MLSIDIDIILFGSIDVWWLFFFILSFFLLSYCIFLKADTKFWTRFILSCRWLESIFICLQILGCLLFFNLLFLYFFKSPSSSFCFWLSLLDELLWRLFSVSRSFSSHFYTHHSHRWCTRTCSSCSITIGWHCICWSSLWHEGPFSASKIISGPILSLFILFLLLFFFFLNLFKKYFMLFCKCLSLIDNFILE